MNLLKQGNFIIERLNVHTNMEKFKLTSGADIMYVVCSEHLEDAIEEFVEIYEQPPDIYELEKVSFTDWTSPHRCNYCDRLPKYLVV
ncbi:MAG: CxxH/CxxC protein [Tissierellales bacterium]